MNLLHRLLSTTNYSDHTHRQEDLSQCLQRIMGEDESIGGNQLDKDQVKSIWEDFPTCFTSSFD